MSSDKVIVIANMFEKLENSARGKFSLVSASFDASEPIEDAMKWAEEAAARGGQQVVRIEVTRDQR